MVRNLLIAVLLNSVAGCGDDVADGPAGGGGTAPAGGSASEGGMGVGGLGAGGLGGAGDGGSGGAAGSFDCALAPTGPQSTKTIPGARGYHGLAISTAGLIFGLDSSDNLIAASYEGVWSPFLSGLEAAQIAFAPDGNLYMAGIGALLAVTPSAQVLTVNGEAADRYGLRVGPDDMLYATDIADVRRVDPTTGVGQVVAVLPSSAGFSYVRAFDWNRSFDRIYVGTVGGGIYFADLDSSYQATAPLEQWVPLGADSWIDGVATDACGNVYAVNFGSAQLFKITPDGTLSVYLDWSRAFEQYGHGVIFGNGAGGFREDALYLPQPNNDNTVLEVVVGIPSRSFAGLVLNGPTE